MFIAIGPSIKVFFFFFTSSTPYSVLDVIKDDTSFVSLVSINKNFILSLKNSIDG